MSFLRGLFTITITALINRGLGEEDRAEQQLQTAERIVGHARINGIDNADIYYSLACLFAMRNESQRALASLQQAYDKGFRLLWLLDQDGRLDMIRNQKLFQDIHQKARAEVARAGQAVSSL